MEYWITKEGQKIKICDLSDEHLQNIYKMFIRHKSSGFQFSETQSKRLQDIEQELLARTKKKFEKKISFPNRFLALELDPKP